MSRCNSRKILKVIWTVVMILCVINVIIYNYISNDIGGFVIFDDVYLYDESGELHKFNMHTASIGNDYFKPSQIISRLTDLDTLYIEIDNVSDFEYLNRLPMLTNLHIKLTDVDIIEGFPELPALKKLDIYVPSDVRLKLHTNSFSSVPQLEIFSIYFEKGYLDCDLTFLSLASHLKKIYIHSIDCIDMNGVAECESLEDLHIESNKYDNLINLVNCDSLIILSILVNDESYLRSVCNLTSVKRLKIGSSTFQGVKIGNEVCFSKMLNLCELYISNFTVIEADEICKLPFLKVVYYTDTCIINEEAKNSITNAGIILTQYPTQ